MHNRLIKYIYMTFAALLLFSGCVSITPKCSNATSAQGYFCYQGYNFGKDTTSLYREGVKDGCRTANGTFTKNYSLSGSSDEYVKGWEKGRAACKLIIPDEAKPGTMRTEYQQSIDEKEFYGS